MRRHQLRLLRSIAACATLLGLLTACGAAAGTAAPTGHAGRQPGQAAPVRATLDARTALAARDAVRHLIIALRRHGRRPTGPVKDLTELTSEGWSGYADTTSSGDPFNLVSATWTQPAITCTSTNAVAPFWVGMDGFSDSTAEDAGTLAECYGGVAYYYTWWENYPATGIEVVGSDVHPGDQISASVTKSGSTFTLKVTDATNPSIRQASPATSDSFTMTESNPSAQAINIVYIHGIPPLFDEADSYYQGDWSIWNVNNALGRIATTEGPITAFNYNEITMISSEGVAAQPSAPFNGGSSFNISDENPY